MKMEKLKLEYLAPYLPYGLKFIIPDTKMICELVGINFIDKNIEINYPRKKKGCSGEILNYHDGKERGHDGYIDNCKPILRPLSDLTKDKFYDDTENHNIRFWKLKIKSGVLDHLDYNGTQLLLKEHYDIFGLIEKGLAINKNDL